MCDQLERTLLRLLVPDNDVIKQATQELKQLISDPRIVPILCEVLASSSNAQVRQYAALLLRRKFLKAKQWNSVPAEISQSIRDSLLNVIVHESEKPVQKSVAQLIAVIAKHDLPGNEWPTLFQFLEQYVRSDNAAHRELGSLLLSVIASTATDELSCHMTSLLTLCSVMLNDAQNHLVAFHTIQTLTSVVSVVDSDSQKMFSRLVPKLLEVVRQLISVDQDLGADALEILDELVECEIAILQPHIKTAIGFCLELARHSELSSKVRVKALSFVSSVTRQKKKTVVKLNLIEPILDILFPIICDLSSDEDEDTEAADIDAQHPSSCALQVLDVMALHLPPVKYIAALMRHVNPALQSAEPFVRRAAYMAVAVSSEGCSDHIRNKLLQPLLEHVYHGMSDDSIDVRNAAMFALGQFSVHLQPEVSKYSSELLPLLFACLSKSSQDAGQRPRDVVRVYYAMETFCENLGKDIVPYLPQLMDFLLSAVTSAQNCHATSLAISAIGAAANAAGEDFVPYFQRVIDALKVYLVNSQTEDQQKVQIQAIDTLGVLARTLGEHFRPIAVECLQLGLSLVSNTADPDIRRCIYCLFGSISTLMKEDMAEVLEPMVTLMITSINSTEGITAHYSEQDTQILQIFSDLPEDEDDDDALSDDAFCDAGIQGVSVENAYIDEKEDACSALGELALNTGAKFEPFIETSYKAIIKLLDYPSADTRRAAVSSVTMLCRAIWILPGRDEAVAMTMMSLAVDKLLTMVRMDDDRQVVMTILDSTNELLADVKKPVLDAVESPDVFVSVIKDVFQQKMACQDHDDDDDDDAEDEEQAEHDCALVESAGELMPSLVKSVGGHVFAPYFSELLPELLKRLKKTSKVSEKSFAIGTIAETLQSMGDAASGFVLPLYPVVMATVKDEDEEVRSNAIYGLGVLTANGGAVALQKYPEVLNILFSILERETDRRCIDNICAAVCRMMTAHTDAVPVAQVLAVVCRYLPLKEDLDEHVTIFTCILHLYHCQHPQVIERMPQLLDIAGDLLASAPSDELRPVLQDLVRSVSHSCPNLLQAAISAANHDSANCLRTCISDSSL